MPYYREQFVNRVLPQGSDEGFKAISVMDSVEMTSYRSRPHKKAIGTSVPLLDKDADPYAHFLRSNARRDYREALESRGIQAQGDPDRGHAFELKRHVFMTNFPSALSWENKGQRRSYLNPRVQLGVSARDPIVNSLFGGIATGAPVSYKETGLDAFAQMAYARTAPESVVFDASLFLGELFAGLPRLVPSVLQSSTDFFRNLGSDYLNIEFGWKPFISDILNAAQALNDATRMLASNGKRVHRRYSLPAFHETAIGTFTNVNCTIDVGSTRGVLNQSAYEQIGGSNVTSSVGGFYANGSVSKLRKRERWFEGEFSSFYPLGFDPNDYFDRFNQLVNLKITPEVLWELMPWSWLIDWGLRIGDSIHANQLAGNDRLIMHYGYAMEKTTYRSLHSGRVVNPGSYKGLPASFETMGLTSYKRRIRANPYGFRVNTPDALSGNQLAILGALALTKS